MEFPEIPEDMSTLSSKELGDLITALRAAAKSVAADMKAGTPVSDEARELAKGAVPILADLTEAKAAALAAEQAEAEDLEASLGDDEDDGDAEDGDEDEGDDEDADGDASDDSEDDADAEGDEDGDADSDASDTTGAADLADTAPGRKRRPKGGEAKAEPSLTFLNGVNGQSAGEPVEDMVALADALQSRYLDIQGGGSEKLGVAQFRTTKLTDYEHSVGDKIVPGQPIFGEDMDVLTAGLTCVPRENLYDVGCTSSTARPFANSLPNKRAPRGGFSVYPSPTMEDVTDRQDEITGQGDPEDNGDGTGVWTRANDGDMTAVKEACAVIPCGTPENFDIWGVYRCMTVRNLLQLTFPELVAAYLNKLGALWARLAERTLLDSMINSPWSVDITRDVADNGLGATANLLDTLLQVTSVYTESDRYEDGLRFGVWLHRHVAVLLIRDWLKAPRYNPSMSELVAARSEVNAAFAKAGYNVHWVIDSATGWNDIGMYADGEELPGMPTTVDMKIAPEGNFERLDLGTMTVGVTNRNPWDKDDMARNQFTMFWESYEGIIDNGCPSLNLSIAPLCDTGQVHYLAEAAPACELLESGA